MENHKKNYKKRYLHTLWNVDRYLETWEEEISVKKVPSEMVGKEFFFSASHTFNKDSFIEHTSYYESSITLGEYYDEQVTCSQLGRSWKGFSYGQSKTFQEMVNSWEDVKCLLKVSHISGVSTERKYYIGNKLWAKTS